MQTNLARSQDSYYLAGDNPALLADIYQEDVQLINWQRKLNDNVRVEIDELLLNRKRFTFRMVLPPEKVAAWLHEQWGNNNYKNLANDVEELATMFADLFEVGQVGLRLELIDKTLCPLFHVDKVLCRLVTTYSGLTTEWLTDDNTDRNALRNYQYEDIMINSDRLNQVSKGDVLLFKGQSWTDNKGDGVVHRSPQATIDNRRLLLTLDIV